MISHVIAAIIGNYLTSAFVLGLIVAGVQIRRLGRGRTATAVSGTFLNVFVLYGIGIAQILNFVMHSFFGDYAAKTIGWAQSPFQFELACYSIGIGITAVIIHGMRADLRSKVAIVLGYAVFSYGTACGHVYQILAHRDHAANNTGLLLISDFAIPTIALAFLAWNVIARRHQAARHALRVTEARELVPAAMEPAR